MDSPRAAGKPQTIQGEVMSRLLVVAAACLLLSACAYSPQKANLAPEVVVASSQVGAGVAVGVRVVDERPSHILGRRANAYGAAAEITAAQDLAVVVREAVVKALEKKGFSPTESSASAADAKLLVEVRLLEYSTSQGFWTGGVHIQGALKAVANRDGQSFEKMYRAMKEERVGVVPTAATNEEWLNAALAEVIKQMLEDPELLAFLAG